MRKEYPKGVTPELIKRVQKLGYAVFTDGDYDLNIIGLRKIKNNQTNKFDDQIVVCYHLDGKWIEERFQATTDPGRYWLVKPDYKPCAIMYHPQQRRGCYQLGLHRGKYKALVQVQNIKFWRDGNKNQVLDYKGTVYSDRIGLNVHRSSLNRDGASYVDRYSAGCQVIRLPREFARFIELCERQVESLGYRTFSYTLIPMEE